MTTTLSIARSRATSTVDHRLPGVLLFALAVQFMIAIMLAASMAPGYDFNEAAISDLGVIEQTALLFNLSLVAVGLLNLAGGYLLYRADGGMGRLAVFGLAGIGPIGAGVFPLGTSELHGLFALLAFLFFNLEAIACGLRLTGPIKAISILAGVAGLGFLVLMIIGDSGTGAAFGPIGHGGTERMIVYPPMLWMLVYGGYLLAGRRTPDAPGGAEST